LGLDTLRRVQKHWFPQVPMREHRQDGDITFADGSEIWIGGLTKRSGSKKSWARNFDYLFQ